MHAEMLGSGLKQTDERIQSHIHDKFDHQLGNLGKATKTTEKTAGKSSKKDPAAEIADMLRKPDGMRQLILAQEILRRPYQ